MMDVIGKQVLVETFEPRRWGLPAKRRTIAVGVLVSVETRRDFSGFATMVEVAKGGPVHTYKLAEGME